MNRCAAMDDMLSSVQLNLIKMTIENTKAKKKQQIKKIKQIHRIKRDANGRTAKREATKTVIIVEHEKKYRLHTYRRLFQ